MGEVTRKRHRFFSVPLRKKKETFDTGEKALKVDFYSILNCNCSRSLGVAFWPDYIITTLVKQQQTEVSKGL